MPYFSVIIPVFNRSSVISDCLDSVLNQTFGDFEVIVVDNNSTDDFHGVMCRYDDPRIRVTHCPTPGPSAARNHGIRHSRGHFLSFIDSDDVWRDDVLKSVAEAFDSVKDCRLVYLSMMRFRDVRQIDWKSASSGERIYSPTLLDALKVGAPGTCALAGADRDMFQTDSDFAEELWIGEDLDWALRHADEGQVCLLHDEVRLGYRIHPDNLTKDKVRYEKWATDLLRYARTERYPTHSNQGLREFIVAHLVAQLNSLVRHAGFLAFLRIYPRICLLGLRWGVWKPLFMNQMFSSVMHARIRRMSARLHRHD
jgi:glycosyltransferase involved in cell wall biosynthesis